MNFVYKRLRELRGKKKWTQKEVAEKLGITESGYGYYEQGRREPSNETLNKLAELFSVSTDYLLGRTDDPQQILSKPTRNFLDVIDLEDEEIMKKIPLSIDGRPLTEDEYRWFIASVRTKRQMENS
ncbi:helix-turn-helix domain-containing protein [Paenibacillus tyrfis]|uniref:helix-turn-helix domain-containing protein n=1 Tax=Paenibacillus tyrfis TaxID=1501230 RepID=UPI00216649FC|nr:helix-turn-helix transcriptional regulator [Paenibacillus tyrfis]